MGIIITAIVALAIGGGVGYSIFRYILKGKYNEMLDVAKKEAEVIKEKKMLEVKEQFLNKKTELTPATRRYSRPRTDSSSARYRSTSARRR